MSLDLAGQIVDSNDVFFPCQFYQKSPHRFMKFYIFFNVRELSCFILQPHTVGWEAQTVPCSEGITTEG